MDNPLHGVVLLLISSKAQSQMCCLDARGSVIVETPNKQAKEDYNLFNVKIPSHVKVSAFMKKLYG